MQPKLASENFWLCGMRFWKEEPSLRDVLFLFDPESIREVYVVPNFISEGYFTQTVVPRELELNGADHATRTRLT
jgi:sirohydrochlorin ferrochelatase